MPLPGYRIGVDLGGTKTESILLDPDGRELHRARVATPSEESQTNPERAYKAILNSTAELIRDTARRIGPDADSIGYTVGMGIPGMLDARDGRVYNANTTCLIGRSLRRDLEEMLGRPVPLENDANCFTLAECLSGAGRGHNCVFGVIMGTGCGGGIFIADQVRAGPHSIAGEWGHVSIDPGGAACYCGNRGCVETKISGGGVERAFRTRFKRSLSMAEIRAGYLAGHADCVEAFETFLDDFGRALGGLISILDPDAVILGGGLSNIDELYTLGVDAVKKYAFHRDARTPILKNELGDSAGVFGAAWLGSRA